MSATTFLVYSLLTQNMCVGFRIGAPNSSNRGDQYWMISSCVHRSLDALLQSACPHLLWEPIGAQSASWCNASRQSLCTCVWRIKKCPKAFHGKPVIKSITENHNHLGFSWNISSFVCYSALRISWSMFCWRR